MFFPGTKYPFSDWVVGNPLETAYVPMDVLAYSQKMTFMQRVKNTLTTLGAFFFISNSIVKPVGEQLGQLLNLKETPDLYSHAQRSSMVFYNNHPVFGPVRPLLPNTASVGGMHTRSAEQISDPVLKKWIDEAEHGVVYVSFGSVRSNHI